MIDYRTYLTGLVAVFLALGLGMLVGSTLVGSPSSVRQQRDMKALQQNFTDFSQKYGDLRATADSLQERLTKSDRAIRDVMPQYVVHKLPGRRVAIILCGEIDDTNFLRDIETVLDKAGATISSTTRISDDWTPTDADARKTLAGTLNIDVPDSPDADFAAVVSSAIANGHDSVLNAASAAAPGLRLDGDYTHSPDAILLIGGTQTADRLAAARAGQTPETGLLNGLNGLSTRVVAAEPDGDDAFSTISLWGRQVPATVDNIDMASGQLSMVYALAGHDGRFGIKRAAEQPIPDLTSQ